MEKRKVHLIPSISIGDRESAKVFSRYFSSVELDLRDLSKPARAGQLADTRDFISLLQSNGLGIYSIHLRSFDFSSPSKKDTTLAIRLCNQISKMARPHMAVIHPGNGHAEDLAKNAEFLLERTSPGLHLSVENMPTRRAVIHSPETISKFISLIQGIPRIGICIDTAHQLDGVLDLYTHDLVANVIAASSKLNHLHMSDRAARKHVPIGNGFIYWAEVDHTLRQLGYRGKGALEIHNSFNYAIATVKSAATYYGCEPKDIKQFGDNLISMAEQTTLSKKQVIERAKKEFRLPDSIVPLLDIPEKKAVVEEGERFVYFYVPSVKYSDDHPDPFYSLTGGRENLGWADYLLGFREEAGKLHAVLIDKTRKIALEEMVFDVYSSTPKYEWNRLESAIKKALEIIKLHSAANHVEYRSGSAETIESNDERAW